MEMAAEEEKAVQLAMEKKAQAAMKAVEKAT